MTFSSPKCFVGGLNTFWRASMTSWTFLGFWSSACKHANTVW